MRVKEKEKVEQIWGRKDLVGFSTSPVVAARATPVRQAPSQVDFTKSAKKSAEKIRPDPLQMLGTKGLVPRTAWLFWGSPCFFFQKKGKERESREGTKSCKPLRLRLRFLLLSEKA